MTKAQRLRRLNRVHLRFTYFIIAQLVIGFVAVYAQTPATPTDAVIQQAREQQQVKDKVEALEKQVEPVVKLEAASKFEAFDHRLNRLEWLADGVLATLFLNLLVSAFHLRGMMKAVEDRPGVLE